MNILILSSSDGIALSLVRNIGYRGLNPYVFSIWKTSRCTRLSRYCCGFQEHGLDGVGTQDVEDLLDKVNNYCLAKNIQMIIPSGLLATFFVSKYQERITRPFIFQVVTPDILYLLHNKWKFYNFLKIANIPTPITSLLNKGNFIQTEGLNFPVILKPLTRGGSYGVQKCDSQKELEEISAKEEASYKSILVQKWIPGTDAVFGFLALDGKILAWTLHRRSEYYLEFFKDAALFDKIQAIVSSTKFSGVGNFDVRYDEEDSGRFYIVECNPRVWASFYTSLIYGVDLLEMGMLLAQGKSLPDTLKKEVSVPERMPSFLFSPKRFLLGILLGKYTLEQISKARGAWPIYFDPLPNIWKWLRASNGDSSTSDTDLVEMMMAMTSTEERFISEQDQISNILQSNPIASQQFA
jgi:predicted ATP-grasp superfamily ATP-dependent carboligase